MFLHDGQYFLSVFGSLTGIWLFDCTNLHSTTLSLLERSQTLRLGPDMVGRGFEQNGEVIVDFLEQAVLQPLRKCQTTSQALSDFGKDFDKYLFTTVLDQGRRASDSVLMARYYAYCYALSHHDALRHVVLKNRSLFERGALSQNGELLILDFGCGPMIAGLALGALMTEFSGVPLDARYVGIDDNPFVIELANEFGGSFPGFGPNFTTKFLKTWNVDEVPAMVEFANGAKNLLFVFSYFFGQSRATNMIESLSTYCKAILTTLRPEHSTLVYLNSTSEEATANFAPFAEHMGFSVDYDRDNYDFRIFMGLRSKPKEFFNTRLRPSLANKVVELDWLMYAK